MLSNIDATYMRSILSIIWAVFLDVSKHHSQQHLAPCFQMIVKWEEWSYRWVGCEGAIWGQSNRLLVTTDRSKREIRKEFMWSLLRVRVAPVYLSSARWYLYMQLSYQSSLLQVLFQVDQWYEGWKYDVSEEQRTIFALWFINRVIKRNFTCIWCCLIWQESTDSNQYKCATIRTFRSSRVGQSRLPWKKYQSLPYGLRSYQCNIWFLLNASFFEPLSRLPKLSRGCEIW